MSINIKDKRDILWRAHSQGLHDGFINFWRGMFEDVLDPLSPNTKIIEFGSTSSRFLQFAHLHFAFQQAVGILLDVDGNQDTSTWVKPANAQVDFLREFELPTIDQHYDIAFSQEIFSLLSNLEQHAQIVWNTLGPTGVYYASFGWHADNPSTGLQQQLRTTRNQPFYSHDLDKVAAVFHSVGFEVGFKRLTLPYYMIYEPNMVVKRFGSVSHMISGLQDHKILFSFRKWESANGQHC